MNYKKNALILSLILEISVFAQTNDFQIGESLYKQNKALDAVPYLLSSLKDNPKAYLYLGICYYQLGQYENSVNICEKGLNSFGTDKKYLAYNAGNSCFAAGEYQMAEKYYSIAISADSRFYEPILNRANTYVKLNRYQDAINDYENYILYKKDDEQRGEIERMISALKGEMVNQEQIKLQQAEDDKRRAEEDARIQELMQQQEEQSRLEKQKKMAADAERRKRLLEDVASSLQSAEPENMTAGAEGTFGYDYEDELE